MIQQAKAIVTKADGLNPVPRSHMVKGENKLPQNYPLTLTNVPGFMWMQYTLHHLIKCNS